MLTSRIVLLNDSRCPHSAAFTVQQIEEFKWKIIYYPQYSRDLASSDLHLFLHLKKSFASQKFEGGNELKTAVTNWFKFPEIPCTTIKKLWDKLDYLKMSATMVPRCWQTCTETNARLQCMYLWTTTKRGQWTFFSSCYWRQNMDCICEVWIKRFSLPCHLNSSEVSDSALPCCLNGGEVTELLPLRAARIGAHSHLQKQPIATALTLIPPLATFSSDSTTTLQHTTSHSRHSPPLTPWLVAHMCASSIHIYDPQHTSYWTEGGLSAEQPLASFNQHGQKHHRKKQVQITGGEV